MQAGITLNKNCIPFDPEKPMVTSGSRVGTPAVTTRGFKQQEIEQVVTLIDRVLTDYENQTELEAVRVAVKDLCIKFPVYPALL
jgi:glycine hydroxymethyltransferase